MPEGTEPDPTGRTQRLNAAPLQEKGTKFILFKARISNSRSAYLRTLLQMTPLPFLYTSEIIQSIV